jgi:hypothetical protein
MDTMKQIPPEKQQQFMQVVQGIAQQLQLSQQIQGAGQQPGGGQGGQMQG